MTAFHSKSALHVALVAVGVIVADSRSVHNSVVVEIETDGEMYGMQDILQQSPLDDAEYETVNSTAKTQTATVEAESCGLWLAPSTIPGAGLGMYAGRDFVENEPMQKTGDIVIPIVDLYRQFFALSGKEDEEDLKFLWNEYTWNGDGLGLEYEGHHEVSAASPGFGSAANSFLPLVNVEEHVNILTDAAGLHRSKDPGAGAFTSYYDRQSSAKRPIHKGEELFVDYGSHWFESRPALGPIPLYDDFNRADALVNGYHKLKESDNESITNALVDEVWNVFVRQSAFNTSRVFGSFHHDDTQELDDLYDKHLTTLRIEQAVRTPEWLQEHGTCADHIYAGVSTIRQAGRGAFASRRLSNGTTVAQVPLIHITDKSVLKMLKPDAATGHIQKSDDNTLPMQLLTNYCYGHEESTALLCPYGPMVNFINHDSDLANVKLVWGHAARGNHMPNLLENSLSELESDATAKLAMEIVALRNIEEGEELLLDYGDSWQRAWDKHVQNWPHGQDRTYVSASHMNMRTSRLNTEFELLDNPLPSNLRLLCGKSFENDEWRDTYYSDANDGTLLEGGYAPCEILRYEFDEENKEYLYTAVIILEETEGQRSTLLEDLPRIAFKYVDQPYTSDMFLPNAFRHYIGIPDEIFPQAWRNLKST